MQITLRAARINAGYTQKKAAKLLGVTEYMLSNYERGITYPNVMVIQEMEKLYKISYNDIIFLPRNNDLTVI